MSTTTARGALLRRAGTLLVAAALVGAPATAAHAAPAPSPTTSTSVDAVPTAPVATSAAPSTKTPGTATLSTDPSGTSTPSPGTPGTPTFPGPAPSDTTSPTSTPSPTGTTSPTAPAPTVTRSTTSPAIAAVAGAEDTAAAAFIARTLAAGGDHYVYPNSTYFDGGNTIDALIAMSSVGTEQAQAGATLAYLTSHVDDYVGSFGEVYAGPLAKTLLAVVVAGGDPRAFGGHDLVAELQALETTEGRFSDASAYGDYSNTIGQSLAVLALARAGQGVDVASVDLLLSRQCSDGGFSGSLAAADGCTSDPDATAFATQALLALSGATLCNGDVEGLAARVDAAATAALDRLVSLQGTDGGFTSADGAVNANTTGVAAQALTAGGRTAAASEATTFIIGLQYGDTSAVALRGGIAFSADTRSSTVPTDSDLRATPQAALGLAGGSLVSVLAPGAEAAGPSATCPPAPTRQPVLVPPTTPTTTPSTDPSATVGPTSTHAPTQGAGGSEPSTPVAAAGTGSLAQTGSDLLLPAGLGFALVVAGAAALVLSNRRRGAHA